MKHGRKTERNSYRRSLRCNFFNTPVTTVGYPQLGFDTVWKRLL